MTTGAFVCGFWAFFSTLAAPVSSHRPVKSTLGRLQTQIVVELWVNVVHLWCDGEHTFRVQLCQFPNENCLLKTLQALWEEPTLKHFLSYIPKHFSWCVLLQPLMLFGHPKSYYILGIFLLLIFSPSESLSGIADDVWLHLPDKTCQ